MISMRHINGCGILSLMMRLGNSFVGVVAISVLLTLQGARAELKIQPDSPLIPAGLTLERGESFHLAFVTSTLTNMSDLPKENPPARTMSDFNSYVNSVAASSTLAGISNVTWFVIGSTADVDAKDNAVVEAAVYRLGDSARVVDDAADMWEGSIDDSITYDENGNDLSGGGNWAVWSGTLTDGTERAGLDLANTSYAAGWGNWRDPGFQSQGQVAADANWIDLAGIDTADNRVYRFYALSEKITIAPAPGTLMIVN